MIIRDGTNINSLEMVVLGGGVANGLDVIRPFLQSHITGRAMPPFRCVLFQHGHLHDNAGVIGAAALERELFLRGGLNPPVCPVNVPLTPIAGRCAALRNHHS